MIVKDTGGSDFEPVSAGSHVAICTTLAGFGLQETPWGTKEKLALTFTIPGETVEIEGEDKPRVLTETYTASLSEKATLRKVLEAWRGKSFTPEELAGFDMKKILGKPCMITVVHVTKGDRTYANIAGVGAMPKGMTVDKVPDADLVYYDPETHDDAAFESLPEWMQKRVQDRVQAEAVEPVPAPADDGFQDDDIPF